MFTSDIREQTTCSVTSDSGHSHQLIKIRFNEIADGGISCIRQ
jgi:hypothetical protein